MPKLVAHSLRCSFAAFQDNKTPLEQVVGNSLVGFFCPLGYFYRVFVGCELGQLEPSFFNQHFFFLVSFVCSLWLGHPGRKTQILSRKGYCDLLGNFWGVLGGFVQICGLGIYL